MNSRADAGRFVVDLLGYGVESVGACEILRT
jgi:hypothetical protein